MKVLIIRFSSIGDIILTSPIVRCMAEQLNAEVHFLTKNVFLPLVEHNPYITTSIPFKDDYSIIHDLKDQKYDVVIDLHNNLRSKRIRSKLNAQVLIYNKASFNRFLLVQFKWDRLKGNHIVDRYFTAVERLGIVNDQKGLDCFIPNDLSVPDLPKIFVAIVIGTAHFTKDIPSALVQQIIDRLDVPIVLIGGKEHKAKADEIEIGMKHPILNFVGRTSLLESAYIIQKSLLVISPDTGMLHLSAALKKSVLAIYGSTSSALGFTPYLPGHESLSDIVEHPSLSCRPCTKQGKDRCPKGHFKCMNDLDVSEIVEKANTLIENQKSLSN